MSDQSVPELAVVDAEGCIFTKGDRYEIPLYQRPYAWDETHIERLLEDIDDIPASGPQKYYLGSLVVFPRGNSTFEVIDGQQRLTTLYLLLFALGLDLAAGDSLSLSFSCREKSDYTLKYLGRLETSGDLDDKKIEESIARGLRVVRQWLKSHCDKDGLRVFKEKLSRTCLYRIEVPRHTDLNHYFEIMNTRGEQLEQHEVLKAWLMEPLSGADASEFSAIWDACSDMAGYVQLGFERNRREGLFGWEYDQFPTIGRIRSINWGDGGRSNCLGIRDIIATDKAGSGESGREYLEPSRFESVIDFRFFLLHALKVFARTRGIVSRDSETPLIASLLDDKKLSATFQKVVEEGFWEGRPVNGDKARFSMEYVECLLQTRFLFDKCIVKREYVGGDLDGKWSLKELHRESKNSYHYRNTRFKYAKYQWSKTLKKTNKSILMMESCLRVSYTSPKVMHWITELLYRLMENPKLAGHDAFAGVVESYAKDAVREFVENGDYRMGVNTPHVVLNYLDFLLWCRDKEAYEDFVFEFRTSVEHWYPQNPSDETFVKWSDVDRFGNLCLMQRSVNSKFSNLNPVAKKTTYQEAIAKGSLKLREMSRLTTGIDDWKDGACQRHEEEMLALLREACGVGVNAGV